MAVEGIVDIDAYLMHWARERLGYDSVIEKLDTAKVNITQKSVLYQSKSDWWTSQIEQSEYFDNPGGAVETWPYNATLDVTSKASWSLLRAFKSPKLIPFSLKLEYPVWPVDGVPLSVSLDVSQLDTKFRAATESRSEFTVSGDVTVQPYSSAHAHGKTRRCRLQGVTFTTDVIMTGSIKVVGHKRGKKFTRTEIVVGIADVLIGRESHGFQIIDNDDDQTSARCVLFRVEGVCNGDVATDSFYDVQEVNTLV